MLINLGTFAPSLACPKQLSPKGDDKDHLSLRCLLTPLPFYLACALICLQPISAFLPLMLVGGASAIPTGSVSRAWVVLFLSIMKVYILAPSITLLTWRWAKATKLPNSLYRCDCVTEIIRGCRFHAVSSSSLLAAPLPKSAGLS